jgi:hypothetical protein
MLAIISGAPRRLRDVDLYKRALDEYGHKPLPVGMHTRPGWWPRGTRKPWPPHWEADFHVSSTEREFAPCVSRNTYFIAPILKIFVLQTGHVPSVAGRPFFIVICLALLISRSALHFMQ